MKKIQLVIDDGSNFIKTAQIVNGEIIINAFASRVIRKAILSTDGFSEGSYSIDDENYGVTKSAGDTVPTNNTEYQTSNINRVLINHAIRKTKATSADIILTLPVSQFFNPDGTKNAALISAKIENAKGKIAPLSGEPLATIETIRVMPEGVPAFSHAANKLTLPTGRFLIADVGGTTTDLVIFDEDNNIENFLSLPIGALSMLNAFKAHCMAKMTVNDIPDNLLLKGLLDGVIGATDLTNEAKKCIKDFQNKINDNIVKLGDLSLFDGVIYSGGGAKLLTLGDDVLMTDNPQFDNALGCLALFEE